MLGVSVKGPSKEYVKAAGSVPPDPPGLVTTTSAGPAAWAGTIAVIVVLVTTVTLTATTSTVTVAPATSPVPLIVTGMGRAVEPVDGEIAVTLGALGALGAAVTAPSALMGTVRRRQQKRSRAPTATVPYGCS